MSITDWPELERPREKLLSRGAASLSDAELLAIFLRTGTKGVTAVDLSRLLLKQFGSLNALMHARETEFCKGHGLGKAKYAQLQAVLEMARRYLHENINNKSALNNPDDTKKFLKSRLAHLQREVFACLYLDTKHQVIAFEELFLEPLIALASTLERLLKAHYSTTPQRSFLPTTTLQATRPPAHLIVILPNNLFGL